MGTWQPAVWFVHPLVHAASTTNTRPHALPHTGPLSGMLPLLRSLGHLQQRPLPGPCRGQGWRRGEPSRLQRETMGQQKWSEKNSNLGVGWGEGKEALGELARELWLQLCVVSGPEAGAPRLLPWACLRPEPSHSGQPLCKPPKEVQMARSWGNQHLTSLQAILAYRV